MSSRPACPSVAPRGCLRAREPRPLASQPRALAPRLGLAPYASRPHSACCPCAERTQASHLIATRWHPASRPHALCAQALRLTATHLCSPRLGLAPCGYPCTLCGQASPLAATLTHPASRPRALSTQASLLVATRSRLATGPRAQHPMAMLLLPRIPRPAPSIQQPLASCHASHTYQAALHAP